MFFPIGDQPNPKGVPVVTYLLLGINVAVFLFVSLPLKGMRANTRDPAFHEYLTLVMQRTPGPVSPVMVARSASAYDLFVFKFGFRPVKPTLAALLVSLFLHAGWMHIIGNMLFLWIYGDNVEHRLGPVLYLLGYLGTGVAATLGQTALHPGSPLPIIGASGAISGVLGFYFLWFPKNQVRVFLFLFPVFMNVILLPARLVLGVYLIWDNIVPLVLGAGSSGVAHGAHIGGFIAGVAAAYAYEAASASVKSRSRGRRRKAPRPADLAEPHRTQGAAPQRAQGTAGLSTQSRVLELAEQGRVEDALRLYASAGGGTVFSEQDLTSFGRALSKRGYIDEALGVFKSCLRNYPKGEQVPEVLLDTGLLYLYGKRQAAHAYRYVTAALEHDPQGPLREQALEALREIDALQKFKIRGT